MIEASFLVLDCVEMPVRSDKPHRHLSLELIVSAECPSTIDIQCKDDGSTVFSATLPIDAVNAAVKVAEMFSVNALSTLARCDSCRMRDETGL
jgi:hypothetical protein